MIRHREGAPLYGRGSDLFLGAFIVSSPIQSRDPDPTPLAYFITFTCYGARLHGDENGSVDALHNQPGAPLIPANPKLRDAKFQRMDQPAYILDERRRSVVLQTIREVCEFRGWELLAVHVRTTHVHVVVEADAKPEKIMNDLKAYSSRRLNEAGLDGPDRKRWTRHGSTKYLWKQDAVDEKIHYTLYEQGECLAAFPAPSTEPRPSGSAARGAP